MKNIKFKELKRPALTGLISGALAGAHYTNSMAWALGVGMVGMAVFVIPYLQRQLGSQSNDPNAHD